MFVSVVPCVLGAVCPVSCLLCNVWAGPATLPDLPKPYVMYPLKVSETITVYFTLGCYGHNLLYSCTSTLLVAVTGRERLVCQGQFAALHSDWQLAMALTSPGHVAACGGGGGGLLAADIRSKGNTQAGRRAAASSHHHTHVTLTVKTTH